MPRFVRFLPGKPQLLCSARCRPPVVADHSSTPRLHSCPTFQYPDVDLWWSDELSCWAVCSCMVFITDTHDGAGAPGYCCGICYDSCATYLLSIKKQFLSQLTLTCFFYKGAKKQSEAPFLAPSVVWEGGSWRGCVWKFQRVYLLLS